MRRRYSYNASGSYNFIAENIHYCTYTENQYVTETGGGEEEGTQWGEAEETGGGEKVRGERKE